MYSGTTLTNLSGKFFGTHQKIDRVALRVIKSATDIENFPTKRHILHFEGRNGPDGIKSKSPAQNEPWHFVDPFDPEDTELLATISDHMRNLITELKVGNEERAAFEASWLSHALVDGLTPAHHFPYEEKLMDMRRGEGNETRDSIREKLVMKGDTKTEIVKNNWKMWGFKGLLISHGAFEFGVTAITAPYIFRQVKIDKQLLDRIEKIGFEEYYLQNLREIALWNMYDEFTRFGWTWSLSKKTRDDLMPKLIEVVAIAWYLAYREAGLATRLKK